jgi:hypothetical protein
MTRYVFIGWDPRDALAAKVADRSLYRQRHRGDVRVVFLKDHELRRAGLYWRSYEVRPNGQMMDDGDGKPFSTAFSFTRFLVPEIARQMGIHDPVLFVDPDVLFRADVMRLFNEWDDSKSVMCVQHDHRPKELTKFDGLEQTKYFRKNWSSVMLLHPDRTLALTPHKVNNLPGSELHALLWAGSDDNIGALDPAWNHLVGYSEPNPDAKLVHFTLGTPDMPGRENDEFAAEWRRYCTGPTYLHPAEIDPPPYLIPQIPPQAKRMGGP